MHLFKFVNVVQILPKEVYLRRDMNISLFISQSVFCIITYKSFICLHLVPMHK